MLPYEALTRLFVHLLQHQHFICALCGCRVQFERTAFEHAKTDVQDPRKRLHTGSMRSGNEADKVCEATEGDEERGACNTHGGCAQHQDDEERRYAFERDQDASRPHNASLDRIVAGGPYHDGYPTCHDGYLQVLCIRCRFSRPPTPWPRQY